MPEDFILLANDPDWSEPIEEHLESMTDILDGYTAAEQRVQLRTLPRLRLQYRLLFPGAREAEKFQSKLWALKALRVLVPLWSDVGTLSADAAATETALTLDTTTRRFIEGRQALLWRDADTYEIADLESVADGSLTLGAGLAANWAGDGRTRVVPLFKGRLQSAPQIAAVTAAISSLAVEVLTEGIPLAEGFWISALHAGAGLMTMNHSAIAGEWFWAVLWSGFSIPVLPDDAVVQKIYGVARATYSRGTGDGAAPTLIAGSSSLNPWSITMIGRVIKNGGTGWDGIFYEDTTQTSLTWLETAREAARLFTNRFIWHFDDRLTVAGIGFAVYYTSATPGDDSSDLPAPVDLPAGQGIAWSFPTVVEAHGGKGESSSSTGSASGTAGPTSAFVSGAEMYRDFEVWPNEPDRSQDLAQIWTRSLNLLEPGPGVEAAWDRAGAPLITRPGLRYVLDGRREIAAALRFLARRHGSLVPFWAPTWNADLQMSAKLLAGEGDLHVHEVGYRLGPFQNPARRNLALITAGTHWNREIFDAVAGEDSDEVLTLDSAVDFDLAQDETLVSYLALGRLAADNPLLRWQSADVAEMLLDFLELPAEMEALEDLTS